jgi:hydrogenase maturation protease
MLTLFGGKMPHNAAVVPGGVTEQPTIDKITGFLWRLNKIRDFIDNVYIPDVVAVAQTYPDYFGIGDGPGNFLSYGVFDMDGTNPDYAKRERMFQQGTAKGLSDLAALDPSHITESVKHSWYEDSDPTRPLEQETKPAARKKEGYSWIRSPRYEGEVYEVGPLARWVVSYLAGNTKVKDTLDGCVSDLGITVSDLNSVLGRHAARALDAKVVADSMGEWLLELKPGEPVCATYEIPDESEGMGIVDGPRGALGHWIRITDKVIDKYQLVVPTTWNGGPKDEKGQYGPMEQALLSTKVKDAANPFELVRIARSFDPCLACSVHTLDFKGSEIASLRIVKGRYVERVAVIGIGNILMADEGAGVEALKLLGERGYPENVELIDAGTAFFSIVSDLKDFKKLIILDVARGGQPSGTVYRFEMDDVKSGDVLISLHDIGVMDALRMEALVGNVPDDIVFFGIEPENIALSMELSPSVQQGLDYLVDRVMEELKQGQ